MVRHIVMWSLKDEYSDEARQKILVEAKAGLESLKERISGIVDLRVVTAGLNGSNVDILMECTFADKISYERYKINHHHIDITTKKIRPFVTEKNCMDYET